MTEWYNSIQNLPVVEKGILLDNLFKYNLGQQIDDSNVMVNIVWGMLKPNIDRMNQKYLKDIENGKKGGAPKGNKNASKQPQDNPQTTQEQPEIKEKKQPLINPQTTYKEKEKEKYKEKENYNENENENDIDNFLDNWLNNKK